MILTYIFLTLIPFTLTENFKKSNPISAHSYSEKVIKAGFEFEEHKIKTEDGYINTAWRIPRKQGEDKSIKRKPVILQHGLLDDSWTFFALNASDCLSIMLAIEGYDVWLTNSRGNLFSYEHVNPEYDSKVFYSKFWNFTFFDMAKYDFPAHVTYVKKVTEYEKVIYIGHSQGSFQYFINYLINPYFIDSSVERFIAIGTVVTIFNINSPIVKLMSYTKLMKLFESLYLDNFLYLGTAFSSLTHAFCNNLTFLCRLVINSIIQTSVTNRVDYKKIDDLYYYEPGGTSTKNLLHWIQVYDSQVLAQFDYGIKENMKIYGTPKPPQYNFENFKNYSIKSMVTISDCDPFSTEKDVNLFYGNVVNKSMVVLKKMVNYNHLDYLWSSDAKNDLYIDIINFIK